MAQSWQAAASLWNAVCHHQYQSVHLRKLLLQSIFGSLQGSGSLSTQWSSEPASISVCRFMPLSQKARRQLLCNQQKHLWSTDSVSAYVLIFLPFHASFFLACWRCYHYHCYGSRRFSFCIYMSLLKECSQYYTDFSEIWLEVRLEIKEEVMILWQREHHYGTIYKSTLYFCS